MTSNDTNGSAKGVFEVPAISDGLVDAAAEVMARKMKQMAPFREVARAVLNAAYAPMVSGACAERDNEIARLTAERDQLQQALQVSKRNA